MFKMDHINFNVKNLDQSIAFYRDVFSMKETRRKEADDGSFILVFMIEEQSGFTLELTWLREHPQAYDLGEGEFHLAFKTPNYDEAYKTHKELGIICFENPAMGIYFVEDPDGYWIEVIPER